MLSCKKRPSLSPPESRDRQPTSQHNGQWLVLNHCSCGVVSLLCATPSTHTHTSANSCVPSQRRTPSWTPGTFSSRLEDKTTKNAPPSFDSFVNLLPRHHPSHKDCQALPVRTQTKPSAFRHERRRCEASTTHSHACEQVSRARLRRHFSNLMRYPSYAQRTSTTLPSCGKLQFLKTQSQQRTLFTRAPPPPRRQDVSPRHV